MSEIGYTRGRWPRIATCGAPFVHGKAHLRISSWHAKTTATAVDSARENSVRAAVRASSTVDEASLKPAWALLARASASAAAPLPCLSAALVGVLVGMGVGAWVGVGVSIGSVRC